MSTKEAKKIVDREMEGGTGNAILAVQYLIAENIEDNTKAIKKLTDIIEAAMPASQDVITEEAPKPRPASKSKPETDATATSEKTSPPPAAPDGTADTGSNEPPLFTAPVVPPASGTSDSAPVGKTTGDNKPPK